MKDNNKLHKQHYKVSGMHCPSCEILIEKKLLDIKGIKSVRASVGKNEVEIEFADHKTSLNHLNEIFKKDGYTFAEAADIDTAQNKTNILTIIVIPLLLVGLFLLLNKFGLAKLISVNSTSSLPTFFLLGIIAGFSSCAALVGGLVLSMSKQWSEVYQEQNTLKNLQPHLLFNVGRLISYAGLGAVLGTLGSAIHISPTFTSTLVIIISLVMIILGLQMFGVKSLSRFQLSMPKALTRYAADEKNFRGHYMPFFMGALTFFLPCGFTISAQGLALLSGNALMGGLIMLSFALGTLPMLIFIGFSSIKLLVQPSISNYFLKIAGILVIFFALYNFNNQLNVLGVASLNDLNILTNKTSGAANDDSNLPPLINGVQIIKMVASASGYSPNYFKIRAGIPVNWEITDTGTSQCTRAIISQTLFSGQIDLTPGETTTKNFTPPSQPGRYKFSCWMGMVTGVMEVVDNPSSIIPSANASTVNSSESNLGSCSFSSSNVNGGTSNAAAGGGCGCSGGNKPVISDNAPTPAQTNQTNNIQVIKTTFTQADDVQPNKFTVKAGLPVRFEVDPKEDASGCMSTIMIQKLYNTPQLIRAGQKIVMEFTPELPGQYLITCAMGVPRGQITVE